MHRGEVLEGVVLVLGLAGIAAAATTTASTRRGEWHTGRCLRLLEVREFVCHGKHLGVHDAHLILLDVHVLGECLHLMLGVFDCGRDDDDLRNLSCKRLGKMFINLLAHVHDEIFQPTKPISLIGTLL